jgi:copper(I)-binding protein
MKTGPLSAFACAIFCSIWAATAQADELAVSGAWVREGPPTTQVLAGYAQITNPGAEDISIIEVSSPQFETVEIHRTEIVDGMARMVAQPQIVVPAGGSVTFEPGGLHLMLIQAQQPLVSGDHVEIHLQLNTGSQLRVDAEVRPDSDAATGMDHSHHHH